MVAVLAAGEGSGGPPLAAEEAVFGCGAERPPGTAAADAAVGSGRPLIVACSDDQKFQLP
eukprot:m.445647 g.445647  ORF g.445647 m.445647 type:complete len:60 (+) comp19260_c0_seq1:787-966(+)